jgi:pimeloyl-ACP methyl ester carboxylesterase
MSMLTLPDGRELELTVSGPDDAPVLLFHHGTPGSHSPFRFIERAAHERGLRYVSAARPGYAHSTRREGRSVGDVADDIDAVLDHLGVDTCITLGWSGGGPHALASVARRPERVTAAVVAAGVAPYGGSGGDGMGHDEFLAGMGEQNIHEFGLSIEGEHAIRPLAEEEAAGLRHADAAGLIAEMATLFPAVDVAVTTDEVGADLAASMRLGLAVTADGWIDDDLVFCRPWGFDIAAISRPVFVWQGGEDLMVPMAHGHWLADRVPGVTTHLLPEEGHVSLVVNHIATMLDEAVAAG